MNLHKAKLWKRFAAVMMDGFILLVSALLFCYIAAAFMGYDAQSLALGEAYDRYAQEYGVDFNRAVSDYDSLTEEEIARIDEAYAALSSDESLMTAYASMLRLTMTIAMVGIGAAYLILEFFCPLLLGNGQTLGKKFMGIGLVQQDGSQVAPLNLFVRTFVGKYTIETMIPVLLLLMMAFGMMGLMAPVIILVMLVGEILLMATSKHNALIHDRMASTVCVDMAQQHILRRPRL